MPRPKKRDPLQEQMLAFLPYLDAKSIANILIQSPDIDAFLPSTEQEKQYPVDPVEFMTQTLGYAMWPKLAEICHSVQEHKNTVVASGFGVGKSVQAAAMAMWWMTIHKPAIVITLAPSFSQVQGVIWRYMRAAGRKAELPGTIFDTPRWEVAPDHYAVGLSPRKSSAEDVTTIHGFHGPHVLVVLDEAAGLPSLIWDAVAGLVVGENCRLLAIGNPIEQGGPFWAACNSQSWHHIRISCFEHPNVVEGREVIPGAVTRGWIEERITDGWATEVEAGTPEAVELPWLQRWFLPTPIFMAKVQGIAPPQAEDQLIHLAWVVEAQNRVIEDRHAEVVLGLDPAPRGGDDNALCTRFGQSVRSIKRLKGQDTQVMAEWLAMTIRETGAIKAYVEDMGCFDDQTEILTEAGWKFFPEVTYQDKVLSLNPKTSEVVYCQPSRVWSSKYNGKMYAYEGQTVNFRVTPDHNMFFRREKTPDWYIERLADIDIEHMRMKHDFLWHGVEQENFVVPGVTKYMVSLKKGTNKAATGNHTLREYSTEDITVKMDDWLRVLGWLLSEGHTTKDKKGMYYVGISQKDPEKIELIEQDLDQLGLPYNRKKAKPHTQFLLYSKQLYEEVHAYGARAPKKRVPAYVKALSPRQIQIFLDTFLLGDGYIHKGTKYYITSSRLMADDLQELLLKQGKYASVSFRGKAGDTAEIDGREITRTAPQYCVSEHNRQYDAVVRKSLLTELDYNGMIYCVTVDPYHLIYTRRQGKCIWTGNSGAGTVDKARAMGLPVIAVNTSRSARQKKRFANLRAECWWIVRELLREGKMSLPANDHLLAGDLVAPKYKPDNYGRILIEDKEEIRGRLGRSPDSGDSLAITYAQPVVEVGDEVIKGARELTEGKDGGSSSRWVVEGRRRVSRWRR